ncbi:hypothetical protein FA13DRAFT_1725271 [Coprinellus micaceus]|uniref:Uncharacterized protein n=1 Tax=Coprinellus micaceus TaxID=71717 RepID=A0A4Y7TYP7_COPMI|nr:hypothetical protein FA13DRAFT_1725271 [Coprinellus micaceus]
MPNPDRKAIEYNLIWMERTFKERRTTERLLAPELENGILTQHDYDLAVNFLPGLHRHYNSLGTVLGAGAAYGAKRTQPKWTTGRTASFVFLGALTGRAIGSALAVYAHYRFIDQIREPEGFSKAMDNIQQRMGTPRVGGAPIIIKRPNNDTSSSSSSEFPPMPDGFSQPQPVTDRLETAPVPPMSTSPPSQHLQETTWDRIRKANGNGASQSSWDTIRQNHEKAQIQRRPPSQTHPLSDDPRYPANRLDEQATFDAMLEKERNFKG